MKIFGTVATALMLAALPARAIDFLGVELCAGSTDTAVTLPPASPLVLESVEIGDSGGLVMLLSARSGRVMEHVDDLMTGLTGRRGEGDGDTLQWSDSRLTALAQLVAKKYAALAVTSSEPCRGAATAGGPEAAPAAPAAPEASPVPPAGAAATAVAAAEAVAAAIQPAPAATPGPAPAPAAAVDYQVIGAITHEAADRTWVDVMGVVANRTATSHRLATFDVSLYDADGRLICVDTISVSVLKAGQERAFRDAIRCPDYAAEAVDRVELQFAGGL